MHKRILAICLLLLVCLSFVSCVDPLLDPKLKDRVTHYYNPSGIGVYKMEFQGVAYPKSPFFCVKYDESDPMVSWRSSMRLIVDPGIRIFGDNFDNPVFMYYPSSDAHHLPIYLTEEFDYSSDTFVLDGTDASILWSEVLTEKTMLLMADYRYTITMHSETHPRILAYMQICRVNREWYASFYQEYYGVDNKEMYKLSDLFVALLVENGLIEDINWPDTTPAES